ncbi:MAG: [FeFe] hydrogenase H-cluster radical SAM maturase HydG [Oligoflexia bacterium]|nr:[FeFe] hydrogenase H-cluster radical SAM maturase HydG [Oligoflexia bacterium]
MSFIDETQTQIEIKSEEKLQMHKDDKVYLREIFDKAKELKGIDYQDVLTLLQLKDSESITELYRTAREIKDKIYGKRVVLFAPLYVSNICSNECLYCGFRSSNHLLQRRMLSQEEIKRETKQLINDGHKRVLLVAGEDCSARALDYMMESISSVYSLHLEKGNIRRINVNMAPLSVEGFKKLSECKIGTYQIFQETYHRETYKRLHLKGQKSDYDYRLHAMDRAMEAGIEDVGIGVLFGLYDYKFEVLALLKHIKHLEKSFGVGPHTISVPRIEPALGSEVSYNPPYPVDDESFKKIIAILRLAVPYTGLILSTREGEEMRRNALELGISQISAGSKTGPGGYSGASEVSGVIGDIKSDNSLQEQFSLGDHRPMVEVIKDIVNDGYIPSFCTGCYRMGRIGHDFMDLAKPGLIHKHCTPNALLTFKEYLEDFADSDLKIKGEQMIDKIVANEFAGESITFVSKLKTKLLSTANGERDLYY